MDRINDKQLIRILILAVVILAVGEVYLIVVSLRSPFSASIPSGGVLVYASSTSALPNSPLLPDNGTVPSIPLTALTPVAGTVQSIGSGSLVVKGGSGSITISVSSGTTIVQEGAPKSMAAQAADIQQFHDSYEQLAQDPQKNADALENMIAPSPDQETKISLSDLKAGDTVSVLGHQQPDGSIAAVKITLIGSGAQSQ